MGQQQSNATDKLAAHREMLYRRQLQHHQRVELTRQQAAQQLKLGNRQGALNLARQLKTLEQQERTIAGIVTNLDAQRATLETKEITNETMQVMAACVKTLGKGALSVDVVEDCLEANDDAAAELKEVAEALSLPYAPGDDDDALLEQLNVKFGAAATAAAAEAGGAGDMAENANMTMDERFLAWARNELAQRNPPCSAGGKAASNGGGSSGSVAPLMAYPPVPTHSLGDLGGGRSANVVAAAMLM